MWEGLTRAPGLFDNRFDYVRGRVELHSSNGSVSNAPAAPCVEKKQFCKSNSSIRLFPSNPLRKAKIVRGIRHGTGRKHHYAA